MSRSVDERVVKMTFDNKSFESGVQTTLKSLDKLKQSSNLDGVTKGMDNLARSTKSVSLDAISQGVSALERRFSTLGIVGMQVISNITNSVTSLAGRMTSFITNEIIQGGIDRVMNVEQARFQLKGLMGDMDEVQRVMDKAKESVSNTAYTYGEAANAASMFVASGLSDNESLQLSLSALADTAAATNSDYQGMANIFTTVAGNGRLMGEQLNQLAARGTNAAALLAKYLNETGRAAGVTEADIREMCSKGQIDFKTFAEAMEYTFGGHAKDMDNTFSGVTANIRAALARIGEGFLTIQDAETGVSTTLLGEGSVVVKFLQTVKQKINDVNEALTPLQEVVYHFLENLFPKMTKFVEGIDVKPPIENAVKALTNLKSSMNGNSQVAENLKNTFKGVGAVLDIARKGFDALLKLLSPVGKGIGELAKGALSFTGAIGQWLVKLDQGITGLSGFSVSTDKATSKVKPAAKIFEALKSVFSSIGDVLKQLSPVFEAFGNAIEKICDRINNSLSNLKITDFVNGAALTGLIMMVKEIVGMFRDVTSKGSAFLTNINKILYSLNYNLKAMTVQIQAKAIRDIAVSVAILAGACFVLSTVDAKGLAGSLTVITAAIVEMIGAFSILSGSLGLKASVSVSLITGAMINMSAALLILSSAVKVLSGVDFGHLAASIVALGVMMLELSVSMKLISKLDSKGLSKTSFAMIEMAVALNIMASAVKKLGQMPFVELAKGLGAIAVALGIFIATVRLLPKEAQFTQIAKSILIFSAALVVMAAAFKILGSMKLEEVGIALAAVAGAMAIFVIAFKKMPQAPRVASLAQSMMTFSGALAVMAVALKIMGSMSPQETATGLIAFAGAMTILVVALKKMPQAPRVASLAQSMLTLSGALVVMATALKIMGGMSPGEVATALITLAGALTVLGVASKLLGPMAAEMTAVAGSLALFGVGIGAIGAGVFLLATGFTMLAVAGTAAAASVVASLEIIIVGVLGIIANSTKALGDAVKAVILTLIDVIVECAPAIVDGALTLIEVVLKSLSEHAPTIINYLFDFVIGVINALADRMPEFVHAAMNLIGTFFQSIIEELSSMDTKALIETIAGIGLIAAIIAACAALAPMIPQAMVGILGFGACVTELALVLAAVGAFAQIPGLKWFISEGGDLLQEVGTAIGKFIGGFIGGVAEGVFAQLPKMGTDLSNFMLAVEGFIEGAKKIDASVLEGVGILAGTIIALSAAEIINGLASWLTGGSSLIKFGQELAAFAPLFKAYADTVSDIDAKVVKASANAAKSLADMANNLPNQGGLVSWIVGDNRLSVFGKELAEFGPYMKQYGEDVSGLKASAVKASANAASVLSEMASKLPNQGGLVSWIVGDNRLSVFGKELSAFGPYMKQYGEDVSGLKSSAVKASANAASVLSEMASKLPNQGGLVSWIVGDNRLSVFGRELAAFGPYLAAYGVAVKDVKPEAVQASASAGSILAELASKLPKSNSIFSWFTGGRTDFASFGMQLTYFGLGMKSYGESVDGINMEAVNASASAAEALSKLANGLPETRKLSEWFLGGDTMNLQEFGKQLIFFGAGLKGYSSNIDGVDTDAIQASATAAEALSNLANGLPTVTGPIKAWFGESQLDLGTFGKQIAMFGKGMKSYSESIGDKFNAKAVEVSVKSAESLSALANGLPTIEGPIKAWFDGQKLDLGTFGEQLFYFGKGMASYSESIGDGFNAKAVEASAHAAKALSKLANGLPTVEGPIKAFFDGQQMNLATFGQQLYYFGKGMKEYSEQLGGDFNAKAVESSAHAAEALSALASGLPTVEGPIKSFFGGQQLDLGTFGTQLHYFGKGMKDYADALGSKFDGAIVESSAHAALSLAELAKSLPETGGAISSWFSGQMSLADFGVQLKAFGKGLVDYSAAISGKVDATAVETSAHAAMALAELAKALPTTGGIFGEWFGGQMSLEAFGAQLKSFGNGLVDYSTTVTGKVNAEAVTSSATAATALAQLANGLPETDGKIASWFGGGTMDMATFGNQLKSFGEALVSYSGSVANVDPGSMAGIIVELNKLCDFAERAAGLDTSAMSGFSLALTSMANAGISELVSAFTGSSGKVTSAANGVLQALNTAIKGQTSTLQTTSKDVGTKAMDGLIQGMNSKRALSTQTVTNLCQAITSRFKTTLTTQTLKSVGEALITGLANGIQSSTSKITSTVKTLCDKIIEAFNKNLKQSDMKKIADTAIGYLKDALSSYAKEDSAVYDAAKDVGKYVALGIAKGIDENTDAIKQAAVTAAQAAIAEAEKELGVESPSKVFYEIGRYVDEGFANGITAYTKTVADAGGDMASGTISVVNELLGQMLNLIESDADLQPTITPVVDLSRVQNGVSSMNRMFTKGINVSASYNQAVAAGATATYRNNDAETVTIGNAAPSSVTYEFTQNNYSPKALSRIDIYRDGKNLFALGREAVSTA